MLASVQTHAAMRGVKDDQPRQTSHRTPRVQEVHLDSMAIRSFTLSDGLPLYRSGFSLYLFCRNLLGASMNHFHSLRSCTRQQHLLLPKEFIFQRTLIPVEAVPRRFMLHKEDPPCEVDACSRSTVYAIRPFPYEEVGSKPLPRASPSP